MMRLVLGVVGGVFGWFLLVFLAGFVVRAVWPEMGAVENMADYTDPMRWTRLGIGAVVTVLSGLISAAASGRGRLAGLILGAVLLVAFIPMHIAMWDLFPLWYHFVFLISLVPLSLAGASLVRSRPAPVGQPG
jgi:hypothetical protein